MMRNRTFTFVCNDDERRLISALAAYLNRTQSDAVRLLIREAARELIDTAPVQVARQTDATPSNGGEDVAAN